MGKGMKKDRAGGKLGAHGRDKQRKKIGVQQNSGKKKATQSAPLLPPDIADDEVEVSQEDIDFVAKHRKYAGFVANLDTKNITRQVLGIDRTKDLETYYERRVKRAPLYEDGDGKTISLQAGDALPVKTLSGEVQYINSTLKEPKSVEDRPLSVEERRSLVSKERTVAKDKKNTAKEEDALDNSQKPVQCEREDSKSTKKKKERNSKDENQIHSKGTSKRLALEELKKDLSKEERAAEAKAQMAEIGVKVLADPESNIQSLKEVLDFCVDDDENIANLAMLSLFAVFKDITPGYRIRLPTAKELEMRVSKEVQKLRDYEKTLLGFYQRYMQILVKTLKRGTHSKISLRCLCGLLESLPHFNYRDSLLSIIIPFMDSSDDACSSMSCDAIKYLFKNESKHRGEATVDAVQLIADLVKVNSCIVRPEAIQVFSALSLDESLRRDHSSDHNDSGKGERKSESRKRNNNTISGNKAKKQQLAEKLREEVAMDFKEASSLPDISERKKLQTAILSSVFETYFRILKFNPEHQPRLEEFNKRKEIEGKISRFGPRPLLRPCLDGLGKFSHLINVDFMSDLLSVLKKLASRGSLEGREETAKSDYSISVIDRLQCCMVAFMIMRNNLDALNVDLHDFYAQFYNLLLEFNPIRDEHNGKILGEALQNMLWEGRQHNFQRVAAFIRRLASQSLQFGSAETMAALATVRHLLQHYKKCLNLLENDGSGGSVGGHIALFQADSSDPDTSGALSSIMWEVTLLMKHYHPGIAKLASQILAMSNKPEDVYLATLSPVEMVDSHSTLGGGFQPTVQPPPKLPRRKTYSNQIALRQREDEPLDDVDSGKLFNSHFRTLRNIKENEALRRELNRTVSSLNLYRDYKIKKKMKKKSKKLE